MELCCFSSGKHGNFSDRNCDSFLLFSTSEALNTNLSSFSSVHSLSTKLYPIEIPPYKILRLVCDYYYVYYYYYFLSSIQLLSNYDYYYYYDPAASLQSTSSRGEFMKQIATSFVVAGGLATLAPEPANAGWATGPGSAVLDPKEAIIDEDIFKTAAVQKSLKCIKSYASAVTDMKKSLAANSQVDLKPVLRKEFEFSSLRAELNTLNSAFDEDTQRGTDRLIRVILQDLNELEVANGQKEGIPRSDVRVAKMNGKLDKLQNAFDTLLKFSPAAVEIKKAPEPAPAPVEAPATTE